jgi:pimeloyl-ACP methyl ester carboxylesterase
LSTNADTIIQNPLAGSLKHLCRDAKAIIAYILNLFVYNEMKIRAGVVGSGLAEHVLNPLAAVGKRVHLVGHSFGGRLMTAATAAANRARRRSHNALSIDPGGPKNGAFKSVIGNTKVTGRIATAHSDNDVAVWILYPLASRVFHDTYRLAGPLKRVFGGPTDRYGAIGANGPQNLADVNHLTLFLAWFEPPHMALSGKKLSLSSTYAARRPAATI